jgi:sugar phosphate isomerase/epimerase
MHKSKRNLHKTVVRIKARVRTEQPDRWMDTRLNHNGAGLDGLTDLRRLRILFPLGRGGLICCGMSVTENGFFPAEEKLELKTVPVKDCRLSRRRFAHLSMMALSGAVSWPGLELLKGAETTARPNSKVSGVQLGINVPYSFGYDRTTGDDILKNCVQLGLSAVELRTQPVEVFMGASDDFVYAKKGEKPPEAAARAAQLRTWRKTVSSERVPAFRKKYEDAGVLIEIVKVDGIFKLSDEELDYVFGLARALGGRAISTEISHEDEDLKRVGTFADKHRLMVGYHGHATTKPEHWETAFSLAQYNGANVDLGHFIAGINVSPIPFITQHHDRITHVHIKDRKMHNGPNVPFGQGDTPITEVLRLIRDNHWNIQGTIEFEYKIPPGSDRMAEIARAVAYCRQALS